MGEIKSAWEKAMERADKLGELSNEENERLKYVPLGDILAARYLNEESFNLDVELSKYKDSSAIKYIIEGMEKTLLTNIFLPRNDKDQKISQKAMEGIRAIKKDKKQLGLIFEQIGTLFKYYEQARQQAFTQLKSNFEAQLQQTAAALEQKLGQKVSINLEQQPQFQEAWLRASGQLDAQYEKVLREQKEQIVKID